MYWTVLYSPFSIALNLLVLRRCLSPQSAFYSKYSTPSHLKEAVGPASDCDSFISSTHTNITHTHAHTQTYILTYIPLLPLHKLSLLLSTTTHFFLLSSLPPLSLNSYNSYTSTTSKQDLSTLPLTLLTSFYLLSTSGFNHPSSKISHKDSYQATGLTSSIHPAKTSFSVSPNRVFLLLHTHTTTVMVSTSPSLDTNSTRTFH